MPPSASSPAPCAAHADHPFLPMHQCCDSSSSDSAGASPAAAAAGHASGSGGAAAAAAGLGPMTCEVAVAACQASLPPATPRAVLAGGMHADRARMALLEDAAGAFAAVAGELEDECSSDKLGPSYSSRSFRTLGTEGGLSRRARAKGDQAENNLQVRALFG